MGISDNEKVAAAAVAKGLKWFAFVVFVPSTRSQFLRIHVATLAGY